MTKMTRANLPFPAPARSGSSRRLGCQRWALSLAFALAACSGSAETEPALETKKDVVAFNGLGTSGVEWNGLSWNGLGWNGLSWNGLGWNGLSWNGAAWNGLAWNGLAWNGLAWNGVPGQDSPTFTTLHNWINHSDVNGNNTPSTDKIGFCGPSGSGTYDPAYLNDSEDLEQRLLAMSYWVNCACAAGVSIPFSDTHGRGSTTFYGGLGLAPTWCGSSTTAEVPVSEIQKVSACLMARVNMKGQHVPVSLRTIDAGTATSEGERLTHQVELSWHWGNLFVAPHSDNDTTTAVSSNLATTGGSWWNMERFACTKTPPPEVAGPAYEQLLMGRDCDVSDCSTFLSFLGQCDWNKKRLGDYVGRSLIRTPERSQVVDPTTDGGLLGYALYASGGTNLVSIHYRGKSWAALSVFGPVLIGFENFPLFPNSNSSKSWAQMELGSGISSVACTGGNSECEGLSYSGRKIRALTSSQAISVNLTNNIPTPAMGYGSISSEAMSVAIRYSRNALLGSGQCDPELGCPQTTAAQCASGVVGASGCSGGTSNPGQLKVWVMNNKPGSAGWSYVHGAASPYGKNIFPATSAENKYATAYIYPIYMQDSATTAAGRVDYTSGATYDTLRVKVSGESPTGVDSPDLDMAYFFPGPPPADADCKGPQGCWMYAGPNQTIRLAAGASWTHTTPYLPADAYSFSVSGFAASEDFDIYVKRNGPVSTTSYDCRPAKGAGIAETCKLAQTGAGGYFSILVRNAGSAVAAAAVVGKN